MENVLGMLLATVVCAAVAYMGSHRVRGSLESAMTGYFRGVAPDPWPRGIQEEDPDRPWGAAAPGGAVAPVPEPRPSGALDQPEVIAVVTAIGTDRVRGRVRTR